MTETKPSRWAMWSGFLRVVVDFSRYRKVVHEAQVADTRDEQERAFRALEAMHAEGKRTSRSMALFGVLHLYLDRPEEACRELDQLRVGFRDPGFDATVWINHAIALERVGRGTDGIRMLAGRRREDWPDASRARADVLLEEIVSTAPRESG